MIFQIFDQIPDFCVLSHFGWLIDISGPHLGGQEELCGRLQHAGHWFRLDIDVRGDSGRLEDSQKSLGANFDFYVLFLY